MTATAEQASRFLWLFRGNDASHYIRRENGVPFPIYRAIAIEEIKRHLAGEAPSRLIVPTNAQGISFCACIDIDVHGPDEPPLNHSAIAWRVTKLGLPLVTCRSTHGKGVWLWCFVLEPEGCPTVLLRAQLRKYAEALGYEDSEVYPKQDILRDGHAGTCIGIPYFGQERIAFGHLGQELTLGEFLDFAESQRVSASRFDATTLPKLPPEEYNPISIWQARETFDEKLALAACATKGDRHYSMGKVTIYAARCCLAGVFDFFGESESEIKKKIWQAAVSRFTEAELRTRGLKEKLTALWRYGLNTGKKELEVYPHELAAIRTIKDDRFDLAFFGGNVDSFASAIEAKKYLEERLSRVGISDTERVLRASGIGDAIAEEISQEIQGKEIKARIEEILEGNAS